MQDRLASRDQLGDRSREDFQDRRDDIREDWQDRYDDFYDRHDDWHHGCWDGDEGWWGHMWEDHTALMAFRTLGGQYSAKDREGVVAAAVVWYVMVAVYGAIWYAVLVTK